MSSLISYIPMATQAAGQNNNTGGIGALNSPWGGSGMDLNSLGRLLDPAGVSGNGGLDKTAAEGFLDPAGIDSGEYGLNLFGHRQAANGSSNANSSVFSTLPGVGPLKTYSPSSFGGYANLGPGSYNAMVSKLAGPQYVPTQSSGKGGTPVTGAPSTAGYSGKGGMPSGFAAAINPVTPGRAK